MDFPNNLRYSKEHEWVDESDGVVTIGITDFAQDELGDIVFVELPEVGGSLVKGETFGVAESVKTVSDLYCPVDGEIIEVNQALEDEPALVNKSPFKDGWMVKVKVSDPSQLDEMLSADKYKELVLKSK